MSSRRTDYPLAETQPAQVRGPRGLSLEDITLERVMDGSVTMEDLRITPEALIAQGEIARDAGRPTLAENFTRAAELVNVPQDVIMQVYELLRPGRARSKQELLEAARMLKEQYGASRIATFIEEAADTYEQRGLFTFRF